MGFVRTQKGEEHHLVAKKSTGASILKSVDFQKKGGGEGREGMPLLPEVHLMKRGVTVRKRKGRWGKPVSLWFLCETGQLSLGTAGEKSLGIPIRKAGGLPSSGKGRAHDILGGARKNLETGDPL